MTILCNKLTLEQVNAALLRIQRGIQSNTNNFQNNVENAVANVTINSKNTVQKYDDSYLMSIVTDIRDKYKDLVKTDQDMLRSIINLETILANVSLDYDEVGNVITFNLGDYSTSFTLKDTTYTFSYDTETGAFTIVDNVTGETVFNETFNDTTYTFSFANGVLTIHNNLLDTDQTFNFDERYYTEAEIQSLILDKIPPEASASNQLADKSFVNSSISTATATFRGTVTSTTALAALTGDLNDYAFVQNIDPTTGQTLSYDRYKWVESGGDYGHWKYEYTLNNSSFTSDQWAAINSGITCQIVTDLLDGCYSGESNTDVYCDTTCKCTINSETPLCLCANAFNANATISTTTYPGACCTGTVTISDKAAANEWTPLLLCTGVTSVGKSSSCSLDFNTCTGVLLASRYCVDGHGNAKFAAQNLSASDLGLTAGCCYPLTCILESLMACKGYNAGTYIFAYSNAQNPIICETGGYAYCAVFTKEDAYNPVAYTWNMTRWRVTLNDGRSYCASAYSTANAGIAGWNVNGSAATLICRNTTTCDGSCHLALFGDNTNNQLACIYVSNGCSATFNPATGVLSAKCFVTGCVNAACPFMSISCACGGRMISMTKAANSDVGLFLSHCADWSGTTYCTLGIEIGSGNVNRGFYQCKAGTFEWLQYWDATCERHACPQCFACPIYGCSSATFAGTVSACNTERWSTVYSSNTYNTGYYLIAEYKTNEHGSGNHDITISGCVDVADTGARKPLRFKASIRGNKCTVNYDYAWVDSSLAADYLAFTRSVDTATCTLVLRIYAKISSYYTRFNTTIDYLATGDVNLRKSNYLGCLTFPNTYAADTTAFVGTIIPSTCSCGQLTADSYKTRALYINCSFPANSTSYILLGCYHPSNLANVSNELNLGFTAGGSALVEKGSIKLLLTTAAASCFCNNNIDIKMSNYIVGSDIPGVCAIGFTSSGSLWNCKIGVWLAVRNNASAARTWVVDLLRNKVDNCWESCMTCTDTMPTFVCTVQVPSNQNFYFNNAENNLLGTWTNPTCVRHYNTNHCCTMTAFIPMCCLPSNGTISYCLGFSNHFEASGSVPAHDCLTSIFIDLSISACCCGSDMIKFCVSNGYPLITPYKVSLVRYHNSAPTGLHINFAICCTLEYFDLYTSYCTLINKTPGSCLAILPSSVIPTISNGELVSSVSSYCGCTVMVYAGSEGAVAISSLNASIIQTRNLAVTSSIKSKKCIEPLRENALGILKDTNIVRYKYNNEDSDEPKHVGIIAEFTDSIMSGSRKDHFNVSDSVGLLIDAVKDIEASLSLWQRLKIKIYRKFIKSKKDKVFIKKINKCTNK